MRFFDYLFYFIYKFYSQKEKGAASSSAGIIGGLQAINILSILMVFSIFLIQKSYLNKIISLVIIIFFQITTYIRYIYKETNSIAVIEERWMKMNNPKKKQARLLGTLYIILSVIIFFGLAIFLGTR